MTSCVRILIVIGTRLITEQGLSNLGLENVSENKDLFIHRKKLDCLTRVSLVKTQEDKMFALKDLPVGSQRDSIGGEAHTLHCIWFHQHC